MTHPAIKVLLVCLLLIAAFTSAVLPQTAPQPVPRLTVRQLDEASYVELAKEWKKYIETNGETADALVNLGRAYDYSNELDAAVAAAKRAVEVDPDHPEALAFYGMLTASYCRGSGGGARASRALQGSGSRVWIRFDGARDDLYGKGDLIKADEVFETVFKERVISRAPPGLCVQHADRAPRGRDPFYKR